MSGILGVSIPRGTVEDQVPIWNNTTGQWETLSPGSNDEILSVNAGALDYRKIVAAMFDAEAWTVFTPTWSSSGTQPVIGNGTITGRYMQRGRKIDVEIAMLLGSTSTVGTGNYRWSLPVTASAALVTNQLLGYGVFTDASAGGQSFIVSAYQESTTLVGARIDTTANLLSATQPAVPAQNDTYFLHLKYQTA